MPEDVFVPVPIRWRYVQVGDVIVGKDRPLMVELAKRDPGGLTVLLYGYREEFYVGADETVQVLVQAPTATAATLLRGELGAELMATRTTAVA